ncbi:MAG: hypothetical protein MNSN_02490 [Minisyncoccus archaeiphilus]|uniref:LamG domain-containing protein n=1 Tax=Minisyncoccus archaeiphilus TaxID=3238481 RepID=UPI002B128403|nr:MAG: hypothetical protein MNSN_02490 [Candidatus Parcubacteria bacterium]
MIIVKKKYERGFTLLEVMIAILIIGIIASITIVNHMDESRSKAEFANLKTKWVINEGKYIEKLIGKWSFDEGSGTTTRDGSTFEHNGALTNGPVWKEENDCISGKCLYFDGVDDYIAIPHRDILNCLGALTIVAWFKTSYTGSHAYLLEKLIGGWGWNTGYGIFMNTGAPYLILGTGGTGTNYHQHSTKQLADGKWHQIVFTAENNVETKAYIDGKMYGSPKVFNSAMTSNTKALSISTMSWEKFNGPIDEVSIYGSVLSLAEIESEYLAGISNLLTKGLITKEDYDFRVASMEDSKVTDLKITKR